MDSRPELRALVARASEAGVFCDFDGSLSRIVVEPNDARPVPGAAAALGELARRFAVVAVISGRPALDLAHRIQAPGVRLVGIHGMEEMSDGSVWVLPAAETARLAVERAAASLEEKLGEVADIAIERKGLAVAVHFRRAAEGAEKRAAPAVEAIAHSNRLSVISGRKVLELRPPSGGNKGDAVRRLLAEHGLRAALVVGDDTGDLPAFEAISGLDPAVRVAVSSEEAPADLIARADIVVPSPTALVSLLRKLARM